MERRGQSPRRRPAPLKSAVSTASAGLPALHRSYDLRPSKANRRAWACAGRHYLGRMDILRLSLEKPMIGNRAGEPDVILVGAGIMSATLGVFLKELEPALNIVM